MEAPLPNGKEQAGGGGPKTEPRVAIHWEELHSNVRDGGARLRGGSKTEKGKNRVDSDALGGLRAQARDTSHQIGNLWLEDGADRARTIQL